MKNNDYRLAVRIYFVYVIKELSEKKWISWEKKKTNSSYLIEMRKRKEFNTFNDTVSIFEIVWYGKRKITQADYNSIEPYFKKLLASISTKTS